MTSAPGAVTPLRHDSAFDLGAPARRSLRRRALARRAIDRAWLEEKPRVVRGDPDAHPSTRSGR